jgi:tetratricopeptide (TPR) repeat protein
MSTQQTMLTNVIAFWCMLAVWGMTAPHVDAMLEVDDGIQLFHAQRYAQSKRVFERALALDKTNATAHYYLCRIAFAHESYAEAMTHCKTAVKLHETNPEYHFWLGRSYGARATRADVLTQALLAPKIRKAFERTIELDPAHEQGLIGLINFYIRAPSAMGGDLDKAHTLATVLVSLQEVKGTLLLARIYEKRKQFDAAEGAYTSLQRTYGHVAEHRAIYHDYGRFLLRRERYEDAIRQFTQQITLAPDAADAYESLGDGYRAAGRLHEAIQQYRKALRLAPDMAVVQRKLEAAEKALESSLKDR